MIDIRPLYVNRLLLNADEVRAWAKSQGFTSTLAPDDMHVTLLYSKAPFDVSAFRSAVNDVRATGGERSIQSFGEATVLTFEWPDFSHRHDLFLSGGASSDYEEYSPHVTISYDGAPDDLASIKPFIGPLLFGPEEFGDISDDWRGDLEEDALKRWLSKDLDAADVHVNGPGTSSRRKPKKTKDTDMRDPIYSFGKVVKVDPTLGIVFGWAMVSDVNGEPYFDTQGDHIPQDVMLKASSSFMSDLRVGRDMHVGDQKGTIVFAWPMTGEIAKAMGVETNMTGLMIGFKPADKSLLKKYEDGDYRGFSIGGRALREEANNG